MAISAYVGVPGSGKSYEVVKSVLLPAYLSGRRIVTNIEGIKEEHFKEYALNTKKAKESDLGTIIQVCDSEVMKDNFFPFKTDDKAIETTCRAGDLIAIDELWRIWGSDSKIPDNHRSFIAEHRHFTDEKTGISCDLIVINQSVANIPRFLKDRIETTYEMHKHKSLGLSSRYRVDVYNGTKLFKTNKTTSYQEKYQKAIFDLYKSYDGVGGQESTTDKRQNIFAKKSLLLLGIFILLMFIASAYFIYAFFKSKPNAQVPTVQNITLPNPNNAREITPASAPTAPSYSSTWRIAGEIKQNGKAWTILTSNQGAIRLEPSSQFRFSGLMKQGEFDGEIITRYSGGTGQ
ncbi:zonular occludens toxin domain-containing protein (plasmid) [Orbus wheelerorum]|uniref:zonular occludens toxin family protein n=1 Tax=Orbus wheelerorum TaxID=3074111 RepID=UPI00370DB592